MKLEMTGHMRMEQRMKLAPRMIQSMEILQLSILALQERIEHELNNNPVLEIEEPATPESEAAEEVQEDQFVDVNEQDLVVDSKNKGEEFERLQNLDDKYSEYLSESGTFHPVGRISDEPDKKLEAIKNTAATSQSLHEYLMDQWIMVDAEEPVKKAGSSIIDYIDDRGYLTVRLEQLYNKDKADFTIDDLKKALKLVQGLEPAGIGARDLKECLLIQIAQSGEDMGFESRLVRNHMTALLENRLPDIAKKMKCSIEQLNLAIERMSKLDTSPGLQIGQERNHAIKADVIVEQSENDEFIVMLADSDIPALRINRYYAKMAKTSEVNEKTKKFLQNNIRSAQWIIDAIEQRKNTLLRVARAVVKYQQEFFEKGQLYLKPLPMSKVADEVGVHLATVSRAVAGKYVQCSWGILPLRKFFSGGTEDENGNAHSWEAIRVKLQQIIDSEDKANPFNDDQIKQELAKMGIRNLARRTVAKYRKLMNIPAARFRKKY
ncbi:MAG: RNA polymerase factor sigma-54 [Planctomycetota bacterium]|jgi:RNA polymerase sigma-54 factor